MTGADGFSGRVVVIIPTYDERDNLRPITARVRSAVPAADVLVVDDNSPDGTGQVADAIAAADGQIQVLHRGAKAGLGAAYIAGFQWALDQGYDAIVEMDADGSHQPEELPRLLAALEDADVVLGSRYVPGGKVPNWTRSREILSRGGNTYARLMLRIPLHDATGGYRAVPGHDAAESRSRQRRIAGILLPDRPRRCGPSRPGSRWLRSRSRSSSAPAAPAR